LFFPPFDAIKTEQVKELPNKQQVNETPLVMNAGNSERAKGTKQANP
jgi:hypothetical protein